MTRAISWFAAAVASVAAHVAVLAVLSATTSPEPVEPQPTPQSRLEVEAYQVQRSKVEPKQPSAETVEADQARGDSVSQGEIPQSRASAEAIDAVAAKSQVPEAALLQNSTAPQMVATVAIDANQVTLQPLAGPATALAEMTAEIQRANSADPDLRVVSAAAQAAVTLAAQDAVSPPAAVGHLVAESAPAVAASVDSAPAFAALAPPAAFIAPVVSAATAADSPDLPTVPAETLVLASMSVAQAAPPQQTVADAAQGHAQPVAPTPPPAEKSTASLAWSSGTDAQIDAKSLATIQSFMRPGDLASRTGDVRDAIATLLSGVPCARLQAQFDPDSGTLELRGHIPEEGLRGPVLKALKAQVGGGIPVRENLRILPRPQCGALSGIATVGLPQSTDQNTNPLLVGADAYAREYSYVGGQRLVLDLVAPEYDAYVYVDFFDAGGQVIHLVPNQTVPLQATAANGVLGVGNDPNGGPALDITIGPPYGQEIAVAFAASAPLYDGLRPFSEPADPYLKWLQTRVAAARASDLNFKGEWVYFFISTAAQ